MTSLLLSAGALGMLGMKSLSSLPLWFTAVLLGIWGAGMAIVFVGLQTRLLQSAGEATQPASALYVAIFNAAIGTGALVGGPGIGKVWSFVTGITGGGGDDLRHGAGLEAEKAQERYNALLIE